MEQKRAADAAQTARLAEEHDAALAERRAAAKKKMAAEARRKAIALARKAELAHGLSSYEDPSKHAVAPPTKRITASELRAEAGGITGRPT
eukprot:COSAG05_NODE_25_length_31349_cov_4.978560_7_plen_91_part_00